MEPPPPPPVVHRKPVEKQKKKKQKEKKPDHGQQGGFFRAIASIAPIGRKLAASGEHDVTAIVPPNTVKSSEFRKRMLSSVDDVNSLSSSLNQLPVETLLHICGFLTTDDMVPLHTTCWVWRMLTNEIAKQTFKRLLGTREVPEETNWVRFLKESEKTLYSVRDKRARIQIQCFAYCGWDLLLQRTIKPFPADKTLKLLPPSDQKHIYLALAASVKKNRKNCVRMLMQKYHITKRDIAVCAVVFGNMEMLQFTIDEVKLNSRPRKSRQLQKALRQCRRPGAPYQEIHWQLWLGLVQTNCPHEMVKLLIDHIPDDKWAANSYAITDKVLAFASDGDCSIIRMCSPKLRIDFGAFNRVIVSAWNRELVEALMFADQTQSMDYRALIQCLARSARWTGANFAEQNTLTVFVWQTSDVVLWLLAEKNSRWQTMADDLCQAFPRLLPRIVQIPSLEICAEGADEKTWFSWQIFNSSYSELAEEADKLWTALKARMPVSEMLKRVSQQGNTLLHLAMARTTGSIYVKIIREILDAATEADMERKSVIGNHSPLDVLIAQIANNLQRFEDKNLLALLSVCQKRMPGIWSRALPRILARVGLSQCQHHSAAWAKGGSTYPIEQLLKEHPRSAFVDLETGNTALHTYCESEAWPCVFCFDKAVQLFPEFLNQPNKNGDTPMHHLMKKARWPLSRLVLLMRAGANINALNAENKTARECATQETQRADFDRAIIEAKELGSFSSSGCAIS